MRIGKLTAACAGLAFAAGVAMAAPQHTEAPKPGPEVKKLEAFAGKWKGESEMKPGPWGPGGMMTSEDNCTWFEGGFQLVCTNTGSGAMGKMKGAGIIGYDTELKKYEYMGYDSMGMMMSATGTNNGNTWTWTGEDMMGGKKVWSKYTIVMTSPTTQTFKWETSTDGKTWATAAEGKSTKQ